MKIGIVITNTGTGGAERIAVLQADFLQENQHQIYLITLEDVQDHYILKNPRAKRVKLSQDNADDLFAVIQAHKLDLIIDHIHWSEYHYSFFYLLAEKKVPFIIFEHSSYFYPLCFQYRHSMFVKRTKAYQNASAVACLNRHTCAMFRSELKNAIVIHNPLSYKSNKISNLVDETIIAIANWERAEKRLWCVLKTFSYVIKTRKNAKLLLVGPIDLNIVQGLCEKYNVPIEMVEITGRCQNVESYYLRSSVILLTSQIEGFGLVLTEAAMHGVPRVAMNLYGLEDVITNDKDGYLIPDGDCQSAADRIVALLKNPALRKSMGKAAEISSRKFDMQKIGQRWLWLIDTVLSDKSKTEVEKIFENDCDECGVNKIPPNSLLTDCIEQFRRYVFERQEQPSSHYVDRNFTYAIVQNFHNSRLKFGISNLVEIPLRLIHKIKYLKQNKIINNSGLFDPVWYLKNNPDVAAQDISPLMHYLQNGVAEGRCPTSWFDSWQYLFLNPDVARSGIEPFYHFVVHGRSEGRWHLTENKIEAPKAREAQFKKKIVLPFSIHPMNNVKNMDEWKNRYLEKYPKCDREIVILHPDWAGIRASATEFVCKEQLLFVTEIVTFDWSQKLAQKICTLNVKKILFQGFANSWEMLASVIQSKKSDIEIYCIYHGSFFQMGLEYDRKQLSSLLQLHRENIVKRIGLVKKGMAETLRQSGNDSHFIMNFINNIPFDIQPFPDEKEKKIGIWGREWDQCKPPYMSIAACSYFKKLYPIVYGGGEASYDILDMLNIKGEIQSLVSKEKVYSTLSQMYINLYVTMSECAPMLPLESLSVGVPCLFSSNNHYFDDNDYLRKMLVVSQPDSEYAIAKKMGGVINHREQIIREYISYAPGYNKRAKQSYLSFLGL